MNYTVRNIIVAILVGAIGVVLVVSFLRSQEASMKKGKTYIQVYVATKDIPAGTPSASLESGGYVELVEVLRQDRAPQAFDRLSTVKGLSTNGTIYEGEQITARNFAENDSIDAAASIKGTERVASVMLNVPNAMATMLKPGHHIDIFASRSSNGGTETWVVARDVVIVETPDTIGGGKTGEDKAAEEGPKAKGDPALYVVKASDAVMQALIWSAAADNVTGLYVVLRPANADQETRLQPRVDDCNANGCVAVEEDFFE